jgi:hypothetical protein
VGNSLLRKKLEPLVEDDDPDFREFCQTVLAEAGY